METEQERALPRQPRTRATFTRRTLVRPHAPSTRPLKTSIAVLISSDEWLHPGADLLAFDKRVHAAEDRARPSCSFLFSVCGPRAPLRKAARQVFTRYQRLFQQRNRHSRSSAFATILERHRTLHRLDKPLVRADFDHAVDVWQWVLRLQPEASLEVQAAALFHDIERLVSEADARIEQNASDYRSFKEQHARNGAKMLRTCLADVQLPETVVDYTASLVARHEQPDADADLQLLNDADSLSFFALNSPGFLRYFGPEHTARKVDYTLARMSSDARELLDDLRLEPEVQNLLSEALSRSH